MAQPLPAATPVSNVDFTRHTVSLEWKSLNFLFLGITRPGRPKFHMGCYVISTFFAGGVSMKNGWIDNLKLVPLKRKIYLLLMVMMCAMGSGWAQAQETGFKYFSPFREGSDFIMLEKVCLIAVLAVAVLGLLYAFMLMKQVISADEGTPKMQEIGAAIREGANAYLSAQFKKIGPLIILITVLLAVTFTGNEEAFRWGRAFAFLIGACFSFLVGFVGMRLATLGNLRVAAAARHS
jgi:K(+)-stimulated pyrophosphate-energized sodium pump